MNDISIYARARCPVLILGPSGSGKSRLARKIHNASNGKQPYYQINIASINSSLFESELFGHEKGSFTGASSEKKGFLEKVACGTLFIDEIGELDLIHQKKLLQVLEEGSFYPVGSRQLKLFKGKIIFATNKDLKGLIKKGLFREDLYYRINILTIRQKPLAGNKQMIRELVKEFNNDFAKVYKRPTLTFSLEGLNSLELHSWPGNIRELKNCIEYFHILGLSKVCTPEIALKINFESDIVLGEYKQAQEDFEREYFTRMLNLHRGKVNQTSKIIGVSKSTLIAKIRKYGINTNYIRLKEQVAIAYEF